MEVAFNPSATTRASATTLTPPLPFWLLFLPVLLYYQLFAARNLFSGRPIQYNKNLIKQRHLSALQKAPNYSGFVERIIKVKKKIHLFVMLEKRRTKPT